MRVGIIGTGPISHKHAQAYRNIGYRLVACSGVDPASGKIFADRYGCEPFERWQDVPEKKHVQVQKPLATNLEAALAMLTAAP